MLPELIQIFEVDDEILYAAACTKEQAIEIIGELGFGLIMNEKGIVRNFNQEYKGHWSKNVLRMWGKKL